MTKLFWVLMVGLLAACGKGLDTQKAVLRNAEFQLFFDVFKKEAESRGAFRAEYESISIEFGETDEGQGAVCRKPAIGARHIVVNERVWRQLIDLKQAMLILHELGHCALDREHSNHSKSVMAQPLPGSGDFDQNYDAYLNELFANSGAAQLPES